MEALRLQLTALDQAVIATQAALTQREADLSTALAAGEPATPRCDLETEQAAIQKRQKERQSRIGALENELQQDDDQRSHVAELDKQLAEASAAAKLWGEISAAIGSKDGARFARFAQSITLEALVERATVT